MLVECLFCRSKTKGTRIGHHVNSGRPLAEALVDGLHRVRQMHHQPRHGKKSKMPLNWQGSKRLNQQRYKRFLWSYYVLWGSKTKTSICRTHVISGSFFASLGLPSHPPELSGSITKPSSVYERGMRYKQEGFKSRTMYVVCTTCDPTKRTLSHACYVHCNKPQVLPKVLSSAQYTDIPQLESHTILRL
jgi:hypothetical protein